MRVPGLAMVFALIISSSLCDDRSLKAGYVVFKFYNGNGVYIHMKRTETQAQLSHDLAREQVN